MPKKIAIFCERRCKQAIRFLVYFAIAGTAESVSGEQSLTSSGTAYVLLREPTFITLAVDSRRASDTGRIDDGTCKIVVLNDRLIFFNVGLARYMGRFVTDDVAVESYARAPKSGNVIGAVANIFQDKIIEMLPKNGFRPPVGEELIRGIFIGSEGDGGLQAAYAIIQSTGTPSKLPVRLATEELDYYPERATLRAEVLSNQTDRIRSARDNIIARFGGGTVPNEGAAVATTLVQAIINWGSARTVGGQVATVVFEPRRDLRWYTRGACGKN